MNVHATIGHNQPPEPTPFEASREQIDGLFTEAKNWLDGNGVNTEADAEGISKLLDLIRKAKKAADDARKKENEPFDKGKAEVQARYNPILLRADLAADTCKKALTPWLEKLEADKRAKAEAARRDADEKAKAAEEAVRAAQTSDLEARDRAEALLREANQAARAATKAENDKAHAKGGSRAVGLRIHYVAEITDMRVFARHVWLHNAAELEAFLVALAQRMVDAKLRDIPGVKIIEDRRTV